MRRSILTGFALLLLFPCVTRGGPVSVAVDTTLDTAAGHIRQFAFDGNDATYFASHGNPEKGDHFTLVFDAPVVIKSVVVVTGRPEGVDKLDEGALEVSTDGKTFVGVAKFSSGEARAQRNSRKVRAVRVKPGAKQERPLVIREFTIESEPPVSAFTYPVEFVVDVSDSPEMKSWANKVARLCELWYPRINDELKSDGFEPPHQVTLQITNTYNGVAMAGGNRITGSTRFFKAHPDDVGAMIHETTHIVQHYRSRNNPGWLVEGLADYIRNFVFEPGKIGRLDPEKSHYNDSYKTTAVFLAYVTDTYDKALISKLNTLMREGKYREDVFKEFTGKTLQELGDEWRETLKRR